MKPREEKDESFEYVLQSVPIHIYNVDESSYPWPQEHCTFCLVGKLRHIAGTNILICKKCKGEFHIPHQA